MVNTLTKEQLRDFALSIKSKTKSFPKCNDWKVKDGYPCSWKIIDKLFGGYNNFRIFCNETTLIRTNISDVNYYVTSAIAEGTCLIPNLGSSRPDGYFQTTVQGKVMYIHRLVLAKKLDKPYEAILIARHTCNNRRCINPEHLIEGSRSDNSIDARPYSKNVKLTKEKVIEILKAEKLADFSIKGKKTEFDLFWANKFGVAKSTVTNIRRRENWKDITDEDLL